jgi:hypothetical protein
MSGARESGRDLRGPLSRIGRLLPFHGEAFLHVAAYRLMVPLALILAAIIVVFLVTGRLGTPLKAITAAAWAAWTPQLFEVAKGLALAWSRGMVFGKLNPEFAHLYRKRYGNRRAVLAALPGIVLALWAGGFVVMLVWWKP